MYVIHRTCGKIAIIAHTRVPSTRSMSIAANMLLFSPNCIGVNIKLNMMFKMKGSATIHEICFCQRSKNTFPKEIAISMYNTDHTGPNIHEGGAQVGLISCEYQVYELFM